MKTRNVKVNFKINVRENGFDDGFCLKRDVNIKEARFIMKNLLGIQICSKDDLCDKDEYKEYNEELARDVNMWLTGSREDEYIMSEYAGDCGDESIGVWNAFKIAEYLKRKEII